MASYRLDVRLLLRDGRDVSAGKVRRLTHHMLQHFGRFGRPVGLTLGELGARWYPQQSLPAAGRVTQTQAIPSRFTKDYTRGQYQVAAEAHPHQRAPQTAQQVGEVVASHGGPWIP